MDNIALASSASNLLNTGSPNPLGQFLITQDTFPPTESPLFFKSNISSSICLSVASSGHLVLNLSTKSLETVLLIDSSNLIFPT